MRAGARLLAGGAHHAPIAVHHVLPVGEHPGDAAHVEHGGDTALAATMAACDAMPPSR